MGKQSKGIIVAKVNAEELYEKQLEDAVKQYNRSLKEQGIEIRAFGQDQMHNLRQFMLQKLVERELLHQEALKKKVRINAGEIDKVMEASAKQYSSQQAFYSDILEEGQTIETYRERLAYDMLVNKIAATRYEGRKKPLSPKEIHSFYNDNQQLFAQLESVKIGQILLRVDREADDKAWDTAKGKLERLKKSKKDFLELAKEHSQCASAKDGGDLGFFTRGQLYRPLESAAFKLKPNEVSPPVESEDGVHLIKLYEHRPQGFIPPFAEIKNQVEQVAKAEQAQRIYQEYVEELKSKARIEIVL
jgi:parvulin-like peptidyl-prolyl isomerase